MYIEGLKDYIKIYTEDDAKPILSLMSMKAMERAFAFQPFHTCTPFIHRPKG